MQRTCWRMRAQRPTSNANRTSPHQIITVDLHKTARRIILCKYIRENEIVFIKLTQART